MKQEDLVKREQELLLEIRRNAAMSANIGRTTLETLSYQNEVLNSAEDTIEANDYVLHQSMRALRGMTWTGSIYNMFSSNPLPPSNRTANDRDTATAASSSTRPSTEVAHLNQVATSSSLQATSVQSKNAAVDDLSDIAIAVQELHGIGTALGQALEEQNAKLNRIDTKVSDVHDKTVSVTLKSSQMVGYKSRAKIEYLGQYQFEYMSGEGLYLSVDDSGNVVLTKTRDKSTYFDVYVKQQSIFALQNAKTLTFLSVTWPGSLRATGQKFTASEEVYLDLRLGEVTGLFFLACNWGGGGWLKVPRRGDQMKCLYEMSSGISDKTNAAFFMAVKNAPISSDKS